MMYWQKDCNCSGEGVMVSTPEVTCNEKDSVFTFTLKIASLVCSVCGKSYKHTTRPESKP